MRFEMVWLRHDVNGNVRRCGYSFFTQAFRLLLKARSDSYEGRSTSSEPMHHRLFARRFGSESVHAPSIVQNQTSKGLTCGMNC